MTQHKQPPGRQAFGITLLAVAALVLSLANDLGVGYASSRASRATSAHILSGGVYTDVIVSKTLWAATLDPSLVTGIDDLDVLNKVYAGLVKQVYNDKTGRFSIAPDLAAALPTISANGLIYTFKIRSDAAFSDGTPVTAQDVAWSLRRVLEPKAASPVAYYLADIKGAVAYNSGKLKSFGAVGVQALDAHTLRITLWHPVVYFLYALSYPTGYVVKQSVPVGAKLNTDPSLTVGAGPWMLKNQTWKYRSEIALVPNPHYYEASRIRLNEIDIYYTGTVAAAFAAYQAGQFPQTQLPVEQIARFRGTPQFHQTAILGDAWYFMNVHLTPFSDLHFRRAIAYAIDRNAIANGVERGTVQAQYGWYPRGILGYDPHILAQSGVPYYNPAIARRELALARKDLGNIAAIPLEVGGEVASDVRVAALIAQDLAAIGITVHLHIVSAATAVSDGNAGKAAFDFAGWFDDYPDPQDFSDYLLKTGAGENWARYSNPMVDRLFAQGDIERDVQQRERLYRQAQLIILRDAPVAMLYQIAAYALLSTKVHGLELNPRFNAHFQPVGNDWANVTVSS